MAYVIGVDGGGTKTEAVAYDLAGEVLATGRSGYGNVLVGTHVAIANVVDAIHQCLMMLDPSYCVYIYLGLAGIDSGVYKNELEKELKRFAIPFGISNDAKLAHAAMLEGKDGILTIAGTGSVSYGGHDGRFLMSGGWGHLLDDWGSGYWIVMSAFKKMVFDYERQQGISMLSLTLLQALGFQEVPVIKKFVYENTKGEIAALVPIIVGLANSKDVDAQDILAEAGKYLAKMTLNLCKKLLLDEGVHIALKGSVLTQIELVKEHFIGQINEALRCVTFIDEDVSATKGAYYFALQEKKFPINE